MPAAKLKICKRCKRYTRVKDPNEKYCSVCRKAIEHNKQGKPAPKKKRKLSPIDAVLVEVEEYNKANGTCLSYGKFVAMKEKGQI